MANDSKRKVMFHSLVRLCAVYQTEKGVFCFLFFIFCDLLMQRCPVHDTLFLKKKGFFEFLSISFLFEIFLFFHSPVLPIPSSVRGRWVFSVLVSDHKFMVYVVSSILILYLCTCILYSRLVIHFIQYFGILFFI